ncbi:MAG: aryl-sulfate sulfotransferase, partial [Gemmatimonadales bacterium]
MPRPGGADRAAALAAALLLAGGCLPDESVTPGPFGPEILESAVAANPTNVLSAVVTVRARLADSVAVRYGLGAAALDSATPAVTLAGEVAELPVLGLFPNTPYTLRVVAYRGDRSVDGDPLAFTTGPLPADVPQYTTSGPDPSPGFVVFSAGMYGLVIDNTGRVVWYYRFANGPGLNFQPQPTGRYVARPATPDPTDRDPWVEVDPLGRVTRTFGCAGGLLPRFHDLIGEPDGGYWVMCDETRTMDLSALGGVANAQVTGTVVQHVSATGALLFQWSPFDHFAITDLDAADRTGASVNWTHGNALDLDSDGNLVVSFRSLSEVTGIDTHTGGGGGGG